MPEYIIIIPFRGLTYYLNVDKWREEGLMDNGTKFTNKITAEIYLKNIKKKHSQSYIKQIK